MKKLFSLIFIVVLATACNKEKTYQKDLTGTWQVYKYTYYNADQTANFAAKYGTYTITFSGNNHFVRGVTVPDSVSQSGSYHFANSDQQLVLVDSTVTLVDTVYVTTLNQEVYTIYNLTGSGMQLRTDSTEFYLDKQK